MVRSSEKTSWLRPIFRELSSLVSNYVEWSEEPPYWNNEAASVSMLIAAASRKKYQTLSDYRRDKRSNRKKIKGRCDLLLGKGERWFEIEAKQIYVRPTDSKKKISDRLKTARRATKSLWWCAKQRRAGLVFVVLSLSRDDARTFDFKSFTKVLQSIKADLLWTWCAPSPSSKIFCSKENGRYYPAVAVLIRS